ncbi:MAG: 5'-nucleotidase C-terminal domain-containing protein [Prevotella sp.]|nr:5'-nucleotidase C-terminal domain-containing protein [Prevotella sp.]
MRRYMFLWALVPLVWTGCKTHYEVGSVERSRILVDARYDRHPDAEGTAFLQYYKHIVDSIMGPKVGRSARYMSPHRPESELSNLLADILVWAAKDYGEQPDFGVYNMGGVRADLPKGDVTYGDVLDVAPFENKIAFATLSGAEVLQLFSEMASVGGEGVSHSVRMVITRDGKLVSATLNGQEIEPQKDYRVATIDYLLGGTDKMVTFKKSRNINSPQKVENNTRFIIMDYFREQNKQGKMVDSQIEGRVTIKE